jgi:hypothetical protein
MTCAPPSPSCCSRRRRARGPRTRAPQPGSHLHAGGRWEEFAAQPISTSSCSRASSRRRRRPSWTEYPHKDTPAATMGGAQVGRARALEGATLEGLAALRVRGEVMVALNLQGGNRIDVSRCYASCGRQGRTVSLDSRREIPSRMSLSRRPGPFSALSRTPARVSRARSGRPFRSPLGASWGRKRSRNSVPREKSG